MIAIAAYYQGIEELDAGSPGSTLETPTEPSPESEMSSTIDGESTTAALSPKKLTALSRFGCTRTTYHLLMFKFMQLFPATTGLLKRLR